jgi:hypothetical protein
MGLVGLTVTVVTDPESSAEVARDLARHDPDMTPEERAALDQGTHSTSEERRSRAAGLLREMSLKRFVDETTIDYAPQLDVAIPAERLLFVPPAPTSPVP